MFDDQEYKELYATAYRDARHAIYKDLNIHVQTLAAENGFALTPHKYPCMTISMLLRGFKQQYGIPFTPLEIAGAKLQ